MFLYYREKEFKVMSTDFFESITGALDVEKMGFAFQIFLHIKMRFVNGNQINVITTDMKDLGKTRRVPAGYRENR